MALPIATPSSPDGAHSPSSTDGSNGPQTPVSPSNPQTLALPPPMDAAPGSAAINNNNNTTTTTNNNANNAQVKRKPSRRANTAERRATHNAVERQRRETLNGRFLDLAALLPNLSQIRRPSKSSIVNSSIAHIHASRRHRMLAARELRLLKLEADALRRELNEWRDRSGLPRVEEPIRGEAFQMILSGEVEVLSAGPIEEEDGSGDYAGDEYGDDDYVGGPTTNAGVLAGAPHVNVGVGEDAPVDDMRGPLAHAAAVSLLKNGGDVNPFAHNAPTGPHGAPLHLQTMLPRGGNHGNGTPMVVQSPASVSFENPAMVSMYEPHPPTPLAPQFSASFFNGNGGMLGGDMDKASWQHGAMYPPAGSNQFTAPASSHGGQQHAYFMSMQRQQAMLHQQQHHQRGMGARAHGHAYGSPDGDDASSVGSAAGGARRERSGSMGSTGSGGAAGGYEMPSAVPRRMGSGGGGGGAGHFDGMGMSMGMGGGMMKSAPISVGGGGNGHGYAAMMM
ncbi:hypothetical protein AcW1_006305 [Taiwanofungus camphoratus]|nr:hypothetical protein AcW1_006305 [Antrodia cinnamomea]